jgi:phosphoglycolate phosphatase-like HAD superfamily hydrolase
MDSKRFKLILFDIDGTLIRTAGAGRQSMEIAFEQVWGIEHGFRDISMMGKTDPGILQEALTNQGLPWQEEKVRTYKHMYFDILEVEIQKPRSGKRLCPGIPELLKDLHKESHLILGLLTGNWRTSAFSKLRHFGIDHYFKTGAFADDSANREDLVPIAIQHLYQDLEIIIEPKNIIVIGDTPLDIRCARPHGVKTMGVATGVHSVEELKKENPDFIFPNLGDTPQILALFNHRARIES